METKFAGLLAVVTVFLWLAGAGEAQEKQPRKIELNVFRVDASMAAAGARGFFAKEGIEVHVTTTPSSTEQMRGVSKGLYNIVTGSFDNVLAWSGKEGAEIVAVAQGTESIVLPVLVRPEIKNWSDLKGKKLAADAVDTAYALVLRRILLAHGLDLERGDYEWVAAGATDKRFESMMRGETFAAILGTPFDAKAEAAGFKRLTDHRELLPDYPGRVLAVNRAWAQSHREDLVRFLRAWLTGIRWVKNPANREEAIKLVAEELKLNRQAATESVEELSPTGSLNLAGLQNVLDLRVQFGFKLPMGNSLDRYYNSGYFREAVEK
jgi:ABC-type nitrate/sulfonate/bicarbonate transport system substrate-binding protein